MLTTVRNSPLRSLLLLLFAICIVAQTKGPGSQSVRPSDPRRIRTSISGLLGWQIGLPANEAGQPTFTEVARKADAVGLAFIEGFSTETVSPEIHKNLDYRLTSDERAVVTDRLQALNLRMAAYHVDAFGSGDATRKLFQFAKSLGVETIVAPVDSASLSAIDQLASEFGVNVALEDRSFSNNPDAAKSLLSAVKGHSERIGVSIDATPWLQKKTNPATVLPPMKARLLVLNLDPSAGSPKDLAEFFLEVSRLLPDPQESPDACTNCGRPTPKLKPLFVAIKPSGGEPAMEAFEQALRPAMGYRVEQIARILPITSTARVTADERNKIEAALPKQALATPKKHRKLLVIDLSPAGGYYHATVAHANLALELMAKYTGAYEPIFSNNLDNLKYPKIKQFDGVFLNSVVGEVFPDPVVMNGLLRFVREGGGLAGIHGSTFASMDLPEYGELMGAADGPHRVETATLKIDDPNSPLTKKFEGQDFVYVDEFYHFLPTGPYSREKLHILLSIDVAKSDMTSWHVRPDNDYGLVWIKTVGKGRVFNCALGHTPTLFADPALAELVLGGIQFVLGDLNADATPSAKLATRNANPPQQQRVSGDN